jgi:hypothetical protein
MIYSNKFKTLSIKEANSSFDVVHAITPEPNTLFGIFFKTLHKSLGILNIEESPHLSKETFCKNQLPTTLAYQALPDTSYQPPRLSISSH